MNNEAMVGEASKPQGEDKTSQIIRETEKRCTQLDALEERIQKLIDEIKSEREKR